MSGARTNGSERQLIIGLDAMEWSLVGRWARAGKLPTFRRLIEQGTCAELASTAAQLPDTVWTCTYTGTNPAKLEKYFYVQYDASTMGLRYVRDNAIGRPPFWELLSRAGLRVGVVDVPKCAVSPSLNGFQLTNWGAHATTASRASTPVALLGEIESRFGRHPVGDCDSVDDRPHALQRLSGRILAGVQLHGRVFRHLMQERPWDVFFAAFSAPHCVGHHFWRFMDPAHPRHPKTDDHGLAGAIEQVYRAVDREIEEMLALAGDTTRCMLVAAHGMGPVYHASWNLPEILNLLGYGRRSVAGAAIERRRATARVNPWRMLKLVLPGAVQYRIKALLPRSLQHQLLFLWYAGGQDWNGCRAFALPNNDSVGAIRINVKGRDRNGIVAPGDEYRRLCHEIADALNELSDPVSRLPVVRRVTLTHEEFRGPLLNQLPDITVLWDQGFPWDSIHSPRFGTLHLRRQDARSGSHTPRGFVVLVGPGVPPGVELTGRSIYDIAPTVLDAAGLALLPELDGNPLLSRLVSKTRGRPEARAEPKTSAECY